MNKLFFRHVLLYYFDFKKIATKAHRLLSEVYSDEIPSERTCRVWFERFRNGDFNMRDKECPEQPKKFEDFELQELLDENPAQTLFFTVVESVKCYSKDCLKMLACHEKDS